jgi:hypothetical protein
MAKSSLTQLGPLRDIEPETVTGTVPAPDKVDTERLEPKDENK